MVKQKKKKWEKNIKKKINPRKEPRGRGKTLEPS